jgi:nitrite reductase/ring-hydroxylating ferredoxin subunit
LPSHSTHAPDVIQIGESLPADAYGSAAIFERELLQLLAKSWLPVGRVEELPDIGSYFTWERTRVPMVFIHSVDGQRRGFYNSCRHRGAPVVRTPKGKGRAFRCQYHSWTYDSLGKLMSVPDERDFGEVDRCSYSLVPLRTTEYGGWIWVDASGELPDIGAETPVFPPHLLTSTADRHSGRSLCFVDRNWKHIVEQLGEALARKDAFRYCEPNILWMADGPQTVMIAVWPVDECRSELEVVLCSEDDGTDSDGSDMEGAANAVREKLLSALERHTDNRDGGDGHVARRLAQVWTAAMG